jgi:FkbM family methyltransferase
MSRVPAVAPPNDELAAAKRRAFLKRLSGYTPFDSGGPEIVRLDYAAADLYLYATSRAEKKSRAFSCSKEPWTVAWLERTVGHESVVYDIGANVGAYALIAASRLEREGQVFAFEPGYASFAHLCDNIVLNGCDAAITPVSIALAAHTGLMRFAYHKLYPGHARHQGLESGSMAEDEKPSYEQPMPAMRLDDVVRIFRLPSPTSIKVDVDGAESSVLEGAAETLRTRALKSVLVEVDDRNTRAVTELLQGAGLRLTARHERTEDGVRQPFWYGIFERP